MERSSAPLLHVVMNVLERGPRPATRREAVVVSSILEIEIKSNIVMCSRRNQRTIDPQETPQFRVLWVCAALERLVHGEPLRIDLPPVDIVQVLRRFH